MKNLGRNSRTKRIIILSIATILLLQLVLSTISGIHIKENNVYATGSLSPQDSLLLKVLKNSFRKCINNGVLTENPVINSDVNESNLFNKNLAAYKKDQTILLPYKYGTGNEVSDGNISCQELFAGDGGSAASAAGFNVFKSLGGRERMPLYGSIEEKNNFLTALGYTSQDRSDANLYCASLSYTVTENINVGNSGVTNAVCINTVKGEISPSDGKKITDNDLVARTDSSDKYLKLSFFDGRIRLQLIGSSLPQDGKCSFYDSEIYVSPDVNKYKGKTPDTFFNDMFSEIESSQVLNNAKPKGSKRKFSVTSKNRNNSCSSDKTFPELIGVKSVVANGKTSTGTGASVEAQSDNAIKNSLAKDFTYGGSPNYDMLMKYYLPSYVSPSANGVGSLNYELYGSSSASTASENITPLERAYNWYYSLKDVFDGISEDESAGCSTTRPSTGIYLQYLKPSEGDQNKTEVQYCPMNESVLNMKSNEVLMKKESNGKGVVNAVERSSDNIKAQNAREILDNLNSLDITNICSADSSFPLCKATPLDCKSDPNKDGCKDLAGNNASEEEDGANGEMANCFQNAGALGWMICPLIYTLRDAAQGIFSGFIDPLLRVHDSIIGELSKNDNTSTMYQAWSLFRNIGNILFVIALLFVIFSQVTGIGIDNYGIKRILPKLIVTAIIVNFSYIICGLLVDLSNIIGDSIKNIFESVKFTAGDKPSDGLGPAGIITAIVAAIGGGAAVFAGGAAGLSIIAGGGLLTILVPILTFLASAVIAGFFAMLMLGVRQALVIIMIVISPIAFVFYAIPNTNPLFKKWFTLFRGLLTLYPVYCFMVGAGYMASKLIIMGSNEFYLQLVAGLISIAPYFAVPTMTKNAMKGFDAAIGGVARLQSRASGGLQYASKMATNSEAYKASAGNVAYSKQEKFANKYKDYTPEQLARLSNSQRRRLASALGVVGKDTHQAATIGAAMSQFKHDTSSSGMAGTARAAMNAEDENQVKSLMSQYASENRTPFELMKMLEEAQAHDYKNGTAEENRKNDLNLRALQRQLVSTKDGQKMYNTYLNDGVVYEQYGKDAHGNKVGIGESVTAKTSSNHAKATLARDFIANHSDLKKDFGVTYTQMQSMQGSGTLESMRDASDASQVMSNTRGAAVNKFVDNMDAKDMQEISKSDAEEITNKVGYFGKDTSGKEVYRGDTSKMSEDSARKVRSLSNQVVGNLVNDPTRVGDLNQNAQTLISSITNTDLNNLGNRTMVIRDANGNATSTITWDKGPGQGGPQNKP
jgi:hypothetical protein cdiviTM7_00597